MLFGMHTKMKHVGTQMRVDTQATVLYGDQSVCLMGNKHVLSTLLHHVHYLYSNCFRSLQVRRFNLLDIVNNVVMIMIFYLYKLI